MSLVTNLETLCSLVLEHVFVSAGLPFLLDASVRWRTAMTSMTTAGICLRPCANPISQNDNNHTAPTATRDAADTCLYGNMQATPWTLRLSSL